MKSSRKSKEICSSVSLERKRERGGGRWDGALSLFLSHKRERERGRIGALSLSFIVSLHREGKTEGCSLSLSLSFSIPVSLVV